MKRSWLVQRLVEPRRVANVFAFGGGYRNGGLSDEAMNLLSPIFSFDYMGAAEYEFGDVPKAIQKIVQHREDDALSAVTMTIPLKDVPAPADAATLEGDATIYVLTRDEWVDETCDRIYDWARGNDIVTYLDKRRTKRNPNVIRDETRLSSTLRPYGEWDGEVQGWLELDNGFMFFTSEEMFTKVKKLFDVE